MVIKKTVVTDETFTTTPAPGHVPQKTVTRTNANDIHFDLSSLECTVANRLAFIAAHPEIDGAAVWLAHYSRLLNFNISSYDFHTASAERISQAEALGLEGDLEFGFESDLDEPVADLNESDLEDSELDSLEEALVSQDDTPRPDYITRCKTQVRPFLATVLNLPGSEAIRTVLNFQAYGRKHKALHETFHAPNYAMEALEKLNVEGLNVGVQVNVSDGSGSHSADHLTAITCVWVDVDGHLTNSPLAIENLLPLLPIPPTMVVRTGSDRSYHIYWMTDTQEAIPTEAGPRKQFMNVVKGMLLKAASMVPGGDPQAATPERPMRSPGFRNTKPGSGWAELVLSDGPRYSFGQLLSVFPPMAVADRNQEGGEFENPTTTDRRARVLAKRFLITTAPATPVRGNHHRANPTLMGVIRILCAGHALPEDVASAMLYRYYLGTDRCPSVFTPAEVAKKVRDAYVSPTNWAWMLPSSLRESLTGDRRAALLLAESKADAVNLDDDDQDYGHNIAPDAPGAPQAAFRHAEMDEEVPETIAAPAPRRAPLPYALEVEVEVPTEPKTTSKDEYTDCSESYIAYYFSRSKWARDVKFVAETGAWWRWTGVQWEPDKLGAQTCLESFLEKDFLLDENIPGGMTAKRMDAIRSARGYSGVLTMAQKRLRLRMSDLDANDMVLNVPNGLLDLESYDEVTGGYRLVPHARQLVAKCTTVPYDPAATCPRFDQFIKEITCGDAGIALLLSQFLGYSLTGSVKEQKVAILVGRGSNGKGSLMQFMSKLFGTYAVSSDPTLVMETNNEVHPAIMMRLEGRRFTSINEIHGNRHIDIGKLKMLTGGDPISARGMGQEWRDFLPKFKAILSTNQLPKVDDDSDGFWRRIIAIPFNASFLEDAADKDLDSKLWSEASGIQNWLLRGLRSYQLNGLTVPVIVREKLSAYRQGQDLVKDFIEDVLVTDTGRLVTAGAMHLEFCAWTVKHKVRGMTRATLGQELNRHGVISIHTKAGSVYKGWDLQSNHAPHNDLPSEMDELADDGTLSDDPRVAPLKTKKA